MTPALGNRWRRTGVTLGQGGQATVQIVSDGTGAMEGEFAAKVLLNPARAGRFEREVRLTSKLYAAGAPVLQIIDDSMRSDPDASKPWYVAPVAPGKSLRHHMVDGTPFGGSLQRATECFRNLARTVRAVHAHSVAHRDLKPENVLVFGDRLVLADLGLCLELGGADVERLSAESERIGSLHYMPKEAFSRQELDERQYSLDAYALGKILYELVTGRRLLGFATPADSGYELPASLPGVFRAALARTLRGLLHDDPSYRLPILEEIEGQANELVELIAGAPRLKAAPFDFSGLADDIDALTAVPLPPATQDDKDECTSLAQMIGDIWSKSPIIEQIRQGLVRGREAYLALGEVGQQPHLRQLLTAAFTRTRFGMEPLEDAGYPRRPITESGHAVGLQPQGELKKRLPELWLACLVGRSGEHTSVAFAIVERREYPQAMVDIVRETAKTFVSSSFDARLIKEIAREAEASAKSFAEIVASSVGSTSRT